MWHVRCKGEGYVTLYEYAAQALAGSWPTTSTVVLTFELFYNHTSWVHES